MPVFYTNTASFNRLETTGSAVISASAANLVTIIGSGSNVLSVSGSLGNLMQVSDYNQLGNTIFSISSASTDIVVVGRDRSMLVSGTLVVSGANGGGIFSQGATLVDYVSTITSTGSYTVWRAPFSCSVVALYGWYVGGTAPQVNAIRSGSSGFGRITGSNLTVWQANNWLPATGSGLQNKDFNVGDTLQIVMSGSSNFQLAVQVDFIRKL